MNWQDLLTQHYAGYQPFVVWQRSGLTHLAARLSFLPLWWFSCYSISQYLGIAWLWLPASLNLYFSLKLYQRYRLLVDTPDSHLQSSAQGYVRLQGLVRLRDGEGFRGAPHLPATAWLAGAPQEEPFLLEDQYGRCTLYPAEAVMAIQPADTHLNWLYALYPGQQVYVLGELKSSASDPLGLSLPQRTSQVLQQWKQRPEVLLDAYDCNNNGQLDIEEWEKVRQHAQQVAQEELDRETLLPNTHVIDRCEKGRLFLISNIPLVDLAQRYRLMAWLHGITWLGLLTLTS